MSKLRDALDDILTEATCASFEPEQYDLVSTLRLMADKCEAALEAPSEMQQLVEWLDINYAGANIRMLEEASATGKQYTQGYADALDETLKHIRTKFLGGKR